MIVVMRTMSIPLKYLENTLRETREKSYSGPFPPHGG
jgi:hypothetical protein